MGDANGAWHQTACILCSVNCGVEVRLGGDDGRTFERVRGDKAHPTSHGYTCEKALRLDHYQNGRHRLTSPLRRRDDGGFDEIDWDTAIAEIAGRLNDVKAAHGGESILYYGGGGQGNHFGGAYGRATRAAFGSRYQSNALAQEKTGEFWVDGQLFGRPACHTTGEWDEAEVLVFVGKNPWQSHGFPRARTVLKAVANDPDRTLIVIDPRRTETADLADHHLQVRPGGDAWALGALLAVLVDEGLLADRWLADHANGLDELRPELERIPIADWCERGGLAEEDVRTVARRIATAKGGVSIFEDLGIQQAPHSTLCSYLEKLLYLLTGNFGVPGAMNIHTKFANIAGSSGGRGIVDPTSPVTGERIITSLIPAAAIPDEILTDHPDRFRAMIIESGNPVHSLPDSPRMREALAALDLVVVIDVALTETGRAADYILPASSQYEKWEATFFTLEFPENAFHLRRPLLDPLPGTLPEPEIHARLVRASGAFDGHEDALDELRAAARVGRGAFFEAFLRINGERPALGHLAPVVLYETLGPSLGDQRDAAGAWGLAQMTMMAYPQSVQRAGFADGDALFDAVLSSPSGVVFSIDEYEDTWRRVETPDGKVALVVDELLEELRGLHDEPGPVEDPDFPFVLSAGERRSSTANTIFRDPGWRRKDPAGALRLSPVDATSLGLVDGDPARVTTKRGTAVAVVEVTDTLQPGHASLPNGFGVGDPGDSVGVAPNELTSGADRDWLAGTPHHKHVPARIEALAAEPVGVS